MAVNSKDIEILWKQYSEDAVNKRISVAQFFESNCVRCFYFQRIAQGRNKINPISLEYSKPQQMLGLRLITQIGLDAYRKCTISRKN